MNASEYSKLPSVRRYVESVGAQIQSHNEEVIRLFAGKSFTTDEGATVQFPAIGFAELRSRAEDERANYQALEDARVTVFRAAEDVGLARIEDYTRQGGADAHGILKRAEQYLYDRMAAECPCTVAIKHFRLR